MHRFWLAAAIAAALGGCATIVEGTTQNITVEVAPATGSCQLRRQGEIIGASTPERRIVQVSKSQYDITFECTAPGYQDRVDVLSSNLAGATVASFFLLDFGIVDAASGAWKKYPERITVVLQPLAAAPPARKR